MPKNRRRLTGEEMLAFTIVLREWWKGLNKAEQRLMMETVFSPPRREPIIKDKRAFKRDVATLFNVPTHMLFPSKKEQTRWAKERQNFRDLIESK